MQKKYTAVLYSTYKQLEKYNVKILIIESNKTSALSSYKLDKRLERLKNHEILLKQKGRLEIMERYDVFLVGKTKY